MLAEINNIELNPHQQAIVDYIHGGLLVMAPVGTGKTLTLAERAANAIRGLPVDVYFGRAEKIIDRREKIKREPLFNEIQLSNYLTDESNGV